MIVNFISIIKLTFAIPALVLAHVHDIILVDCLVACSAQFGLARLDTGIVVRLQTMFALETKCVEFSLHIFAVIVEFSTLAKWADLFG